MANNKKDDIQGTTPETTGTGENVELNEALAEIERLKAKLAEKETVPVIPGKPEEVRKPPDLDEEEYVTVQLMYDGDKYKDDVYIAVNGENILIKRGVPVKVKRKFANALEDAMRQSEVARDTKLGLAQQFEENIQSNPGAFA